MYLITHDLVSDHSRFLDSSLKRVLYGSGFRENNTVKLGLAKDRREESAYGLVKPEKTD